MKKSTYHILILILLLSPLLTANQTDSSTIRISRTSPKAAPIGAEIDIYYEIPLIHEESTDRFQMDVRQREGKFPFIVYFNEIPAQIISIGKGIIKAKVPPRLKSGSIPSITISYITASNKIIQSPPFTDFQVAQFIIKQIRPNPASNGEEVEIVLSRRIDSTNLRVVFDGYDVSIIDFGSISVKVKVPDEIKAGSSPIVSVFLDGSSSEPFQEFVVSAKSRNLLLYYILIPVVVIIFVSLLYLFRRKKGKPAYVKAESVTNGGISPPTHLESEAGQLLPQPEPPDELVRDCMEEKCVLYVGAGLSAQAGFPTWKPFVKNLLDWAIRMKIVDEIFGESLNAALEANETNLVADSIVSDVEGNNKTDLLNEYLTQKFKDSSITLPRILRLLKDLSSSACLTTNFDSLLEQTFQEQGFSVYTPIDTKPLLEAIPNEEKFILKLYGSLDRPETLLIAPAQYEAVIAGNKLFSEFMENLFNVRTILFLGSSLEGIETYLKGIKFREYSSTPHFALVAVRGSAWKTKADLLQRRYGIIVLPYTESESHPEVLEFVKTLGQRIRDRKKVEGKTGETAQIKHQKLKHLKRVVLENTGPFEKLELNLNTHWNILLGDNGVGKSTILKAIALGYCGEAAAPFADRLIKSGKSHAKIVFETSDRKEYVTKISKMDGKAEVTCIPSVPLKTERWLALGFPPIRAVSWERTKGPVSEEGQRRFTPDDLLPLIKGEYDPRMDKLKQWIINIDYIIKDEKSKGITNSRYSKLFNQFFQIVDQITQGIAIEFKEIDPLTKRVLIKTDDGIVPIEAVSQGTTSIIGWIGILLQRMYEIYGSEDNPKDQYALVLIDEIDAHMHPAWQQSLVPSLKKIFPNTQFIATTHSPLIVGGLESTEVVRLFRDKEKSHRINIEIPEDSFAGWRADQLLTSSLFSLESTRDITTQELIDRYTDLIAEERLTEKEEKELTEISEELKIKMPTSGETREAREASKLIQKSLREEFESKPEEEKVKILKEVNLQLQDIVTRTREEDDS